MAWLYEIANGRMSRGGNLLAKGYSGNGDGLNNPLMIAVKDHGPLPVGFYTIGEPIPHEPKVGAYALPLIPDGANEMFGRSGFFIHGDNQKLDNSASDGCIVLPLFARQRIGLGIATDNTLQVISALPGPSPEEWSIT